MPVPSGAIWNLHPHPPSVKKARKKVNPVLELRSLEPIRNQEAVKNTWKHRSVVRTLNVGSNTTGTTQGLRHEGLRNTGRRTQSQLSAQSKSKHNWS